MTRTDCDTADWRGQGERDGRAGRPRDQAGWYPSWIRACDKYPGLEAHRVQYEAGVKTGLGAFCTETSVRAVGAHGAAFPPSCEAKPNLERAYRDGARDYELKSRERSLERRERALCKDGHC